MTTYYADKIDVLQDIFGATSVELQPDGIVVDGNPYPIVDDVIILLDPVHWPPTLARRVAAPSPATAGDGCFATDIQSTFGREWQAFPDILAEHEREFHQYFDIINLETLRGKRIADFGCGIGRWSHFLKDVANEMVLIDFSDAIFVARRNLLDANGTVFLMADLLRLPLRKDFADFAYCLGVAHHLPIDALQAIRLIGNFTSRSLVYLYSALDGHPLHYRIMMVPVNALRRMVCQISNETFRSAFAWLAVLALYLPLIAVGHLVRPISLSRFVPLFDFYNGKSLLRIRQDAYDRFFTPIEQRVTRADIATLGNDFSRVEISPNIPMWHFVLYR